MRSEDFEAVIELAALTVEKGCPTQQLTHRPCSSCAGAVGRIRNLEITDLPPPPPETPPRCNICHDRGGYCVVCWEIVAEPVAGHGTVAEVVEGMMAGPTPTEWEQHLAVCSNLHHNDRCFMGVRE